MKKRERIWRINFLTSVLHIDIRPIHVPKKIRQIWLVKEATKLLSFLHHVTGSANVRPLSCPLPNEIQKLSHGARMCHQDILGQFSKREWIYMKKNLVGGGWFPEISHCANECITFQLHRSICMFYRSRNGSPVSEGQGHEGGNRQSEPRYINRYNDVSLTRWVNSYGESVTLRRSKVFAITNQPETIKSR